MIKTKQNKIKKHFFIIYFIFIYLLKTIETVNGCPSIDIEVDSSLGKFDIILLSRRVTFLLYSLKRHTKKSPIRSLYILIIRYEFSFNIIYISPNMIIYLYL